MTIQQLEWKIDGGPTVPYFFDPAISAEWEAMVPHANFSMRFPFDTAERSMLMPFAVLCRNVGYGGLDSTGYRTVGDFLKNKAIPNTLFIGSAPLTRLCEGTEEILPCIFPKNVEGKDIFFPTAYYVLGNK